MLPEAAARCEECRWTCTVQLPQEIASVVAETISRRSRRENQRSALAMRRSPHRFGVPQFRRAEFVLGAHVESESDEGNWRTGFGRDPETPHWISRGDARCC